MSALADGLYRRSTDWLYYEVRGGRRFHVPDRATFVATYGAGADERVRVVTPDVLNAVPELPWSSRGGVQAAAAGVPPLAWLALAAFVVWKVAR
jgi:hypothetical protein